VIKRLLETTEMGKTSAAIFIREGTSVQKKRSRIPSWGEKKRLSTGKTCMERKKGSLPNKGEFGSPERKRRSLA